MDEMRNTFSKVSLEKCYFHLRKLMKYNYLYKDIEAIQEVQVKLIEKKKGDLRQYNKNIAQYGGAYSERSLSDSNPVDKSESFIRFRGNSAQSVTSNQGTG